MAVSGSTDFSVNRNELIYSALRLVGVKAIGQSLNAEVVTNSAQALNMMVKAWQAEGIGLWLNQEVTLFLEIDAQSYSLGLTGDHASASSIKTEVKTAASSGDNSIDVDSITGISDGDYVGIELDDDSLQWTTVDGDPAGSTVTLDDVLTDDVAVDNHVYTYTTKIFRPLAIIEARRVDADDKETPLAIISNDEYKRITTKDSTGLVNQVYYDPQMTNGTLYAWPVCDDVQIRIKFTMRRSVYDFDASTDDCDFPVEWMEALKYNLAVRLAHEHGRILNPSIEGLALALKENAQGFDREKVSTYFQPDLTGY